MSQLLGFLHKSIQPDDRVKVESLHNPNGSIIGKVVAVMENALIIEGYADGAGTIAVHVVWMGPGTILTFWATT